MTSAAFTDIFWASAPTVMVSGISTSCTIGSVGSENCVRSESAVAALARDPCGRATRRAADVARGLDGATLARPSSPTWTLGASSAASSRLLLARLHGRLVQRAFAVMPRRRSSGAATRSAQRPLAAAAGAWPLPVSARLACASGLPRAARFALLLPWALAACALARPRLWRAISSACLRASSSRSAHLLLQSGQSGRIGA